MADEETAECDGCSRLQFANIETASDSLDGSIIFHIVADILAFVLYMHQQIPCLLQDMCLEFDELQTEFKDLETVISQAETTASSRRKHAARKREVRQGIKRLEKLMKSASNLKMALQLILTEIPRVEGVILTLGPSLLRPLHVYELCFPNGSARMGSEEFSRTKVADVLSRKAIRTLLSRGAGSNSYSGPMKLFLLVKAPSSFNLPLHFLPKRDFRYNKKTEPLKLRFRCKTLNVDSHPDDCQAANSVSFRDFISKDLLWFQCRHTIKGLVSRTSASEE